MTEKPREFAVIFRELDRLSEEPEIHLEVEELKEYEEIRTLINIVLEIQIPEQTYFAST